MTYLNINSVNNMFLFFKIITSLVFVFDLGINKKTYSDVV